MLTPAKGLIATLILWSFAVAPVSAWAQQVAVPSGPDRTMPVDRLMRDLRHRFEALGYTEVVLTPGPNGISGTARKNGRQVSIGIDEKGQLYPAGE